MQLIQEQLTSVLVMVDGFRCYKNAPTSQWLSTTNIYFSQSSVVSRQALHPTVIPSKIRMKVR